MVMTTFFPVRGSRIVRVIGALTTRRSEHVCPSAGGASGSHRSHQKSQAYREQIFESPLATGHRLA